MLIFCCYSFCYFCYRSNEKSDVPLQAVDSDIITVQVIRVKGAEPITFKLRLTAYHRKTGRVTSSTSMVNMYNLRQGLATYSMRALLRSDFQWHAKLLQRKTPKSIQCVKTFIV